MAEYQKVNVFQGTTREPFPVQDGELGAADYPFRAFVKCSSAGAVLSACPAVGADKPIISVTRNGAGDYTVLLSAISDAAAANIAAMLTVNTVSLYGCAVITDATHIAVTTKTDAGVATDAAFTLAILVLGD